MRIIYPKSTRKQKLGRRSDERWHLTRILLTQLVTHERISTTSAKAKFLRPTAERLLKKARQISLEGRDDLRHEVYRVLTTQEAREKLINVIGPRLEGRSGCFTRIKFLKYRMGDRAPVSFIEIHGK